MVDINDYREEKTCIYKDEEYWVRDNGAVLRKSRLNQKLRKLDNIWTFGKLNTKTGYLEIASVRVHRIVASAFHGEPPTKEHIVDHIDTNRQNNRPSNLRWITRLENVVLNEVSRKKIEHRTGVSIYEFLENPSAYRDAFDDPDFSWMRRVTEEEAKACLENVKYWKNNKPKINRSNAKIGEWIYQHQDIEHTMSKHFMPERNSNIIDSLTPLAKQKDWITPTTFVCCPTEIDSDPIQSYLKNLSVNAIFTENHYGKSIIVKYATIDNNAIVIIATISSSIKPFGLIKITFENGYYVHANLGTFFEEEGAEKQFALAQGLEWTGGNTLDDYC